MSKYQVLLTYFKPNGTYYSDSFYFTNHLTMFEIFEEVEKLESHPGLSCLHDGLILIEVPDHPDNHPRIIFSGDL